MYSTVLARRVFAGAITLAVPAVAVLGPFTGSAFAAPKKSKAPLTVTRQPQSLVNTRTATFAWTGVANENYTCALNGAAFVSCGSGPSGSITYPQATQAAREGSNTFVLKASLPGSRANTYSYSWSVDTVAPSAPALSGQPTAPTSAKSVTVTVTDAGVDHYACLLNGATCSVSGGSVSLTNLTDGQYTLQVTAYDAAGNASTPASASWVIDSTAPNSPTIDAPPPALTNTTGGAIQFHDDDSSYSAFSCSLDGGTPATCSSPFSFTGLAEGEHTFAVTAHDAAMNESLAATTRWTVDLTPPLAPTIITSPADPTDLGNATFQFSDSDADAVALTCSLDNAAAADCSGGSATYSGLATGTHTFVATAHDAAGNVAASAPVSWQVDPTATGPAVFSSGPGSPSNLTAPSFSFDVDPSAATSADGFVCALDPATPSDVTTYTDCTAADGSGSWQPQVARDGAHSVYVRATYGVPASSYSAPTVYTWVLDTVAPATPVISSGPVNGSTSAATTAAFSFADAERGVQFTCTLDGTVAPCATPQDYADLNDGQHTFSLTASDAADNVSAAATRTWTVDTAAPVVTVYGVTGTDSQQPTFTFGSDDASAALTCSIDGGAGVACTSPWTVPAALAYGDHTLVVAATDAAGNTGRSASYPFTLAAPAPAEQAPASPADPVQQPSTSGTTSQQPATQPAAGQADTTAPTVAVVTTPTTVSGAATLTFSEPVTGLAAGSIRIPGVPTTVACLDGSTATGCNGTFTAVRLTPAAPLTLGQRYTVVADAGATHDAAGNASIASTTAFRAATTAEENNPVVKATWAIVKNRGAYGGSFVREHLAGATATWTFTGTAVTWWTATGPDQGKALVLVDGVRKATVNNYAAKAKLHVARVVKGLKKGKHTITIKVAGVKGAKAATGTFVTVDAFTVGKTRTATPTLVSSLRTLSSSRFAAGHAWTGDVKGESVTVVFRGTSVTWTAMHGITQGKAAVYVDGIRKLVTDDFAKKTSYGVKHTVAKLADKVHTLRIVVLGQHHRGGKGTLVTIDRVTVG